MPTSRRSFLTDFAATGLATSIFAHPELAQALADVRVASPAASTAGETYWSNLYGGTQERGGEVRGDRVSSKTPNEDRDPRIVHYSDKTGLRWVEDLNKTELPSFTEDAVVTMELNGFRPGHDDTSKLAKVRFAQLHLSCQRVTGSEFIGPLVWASLATVFADKAAKLPSQQALSWNALAGSPTPSSAQAQAQSSGPKLSHMVLNQGAGHLSVNITTTPTTSLLDKILGITIQTVKIMSPLLGFPAISLPALQAFYQFYGTLEKANPANFLLNTAQKDVAVTQQGADNSLISVNSLKLLSGDYVLVPKSQEDAFQKDMDKLVVQNGYLVERDTKASPDQRIGEAVPNVSYVTISVKVQPASSFPASSTVTDPALDQASPATMPANKPKGSKKP